MLKKRLFMFAVLFCLFCFALSLFIDVHSDDLFFDIITSINNPIDEADLNIDGFDIYSSNINYQKEGCYKIIYRDKNDINNIKERLIYVMNNNLNINQSQELMFDYLNVNKVKELKINDKDYFFMFDSKVINNTNLYLLIYKNERIYNSKKILYSSLLDCFKDDKNIYIYYKDSLLDTYMITLSLDYYIYKDPIKINYDFESIYFEKGSNNQNDLLYLMKSGKISIMKFMNEKIVKEVNIIDKLRETNEKSYDSFVFLNSSFFIDRFIYLYKKDNEYLIININKDLEIISDYVINDLYNKTIYKQYDELASVIFSYDYENEINIEYEKGIMNYKLYYKDIYTNQYIEFENKLEINKCINKIDTFIYNDLIEADITDEDGYTQSFIIYQDKIFNNNINERYNYICNFAYSFKNDIYLYSLDDLIVLYDDNDEKNDIYCFVNGKKNNEYIMDYSYLLYGDYEKMLKQIINVNDNNYLLNLKYHYYISDSVNIRDGEIYELGYRLDFIGKGYLNDLEIESGFVIDKEGSYVLMIEGTNQKKIINFEIKELNEIIEKKEIANSYEIIELFRNKNSNEEKVINVRKVSEAYIDEGNDRLIYLGVVILFTISIVMFANFLLNKKLNKKRVK